jgi:acyl CoA:acetate/3-ketoacid CoA transferase beta subunit
MGLTDKAQDGKPSYGYTPAELITCVAARLLEDNRSVLVGTGLPMIASMLAQRSHAPNLLLVFEAGGIGSRIPELPVSVGDSRTYFQAVAATSMHDVMSACQAGYIDFGFLGAAAVDAFGNINTTVIGDWEHPKVRLPGSGGANDVGSFCWRTIFIMRNQSMRTFQKKLDFITTPGWLSGPGARERSGLPHGCGPYRIITQLGVYGFEEQTRQISLISVHPGYTVEDIQAASEFAIHLPAEVPVTAPPTEFERKILREIDPAGRVLGG